MKIFVYKTLFIAVFIFIIFHATIGYTIRSYESKIMNYFSTERIEFIKQKLREEMEKGIEKDNILDEKDAVLVNKFLFKIKKELNSTK
tara:strand:+ start:162 stop:425 length:264 start_codon:yes stop_codon:yes gene_type:complete